MTHSEHTHMRGGLSRSADLRHKLALAVRPRAASPSAPSLPAYVEYLQKMHDIVRASVPLMHAALARCTDGDLRSRTLATYFHEHIAEEEGHDELVLQDLEELGVSRADEAHRTPNPYLAAMVGAQYYWIAHASPVALLGYIAFLEGAPPTAAEIAAIRSVLPTHVDALRTLRVHAEADPSHTRILDDLLDDLDLDDADAALVGASALQTAWLSHASRERTGGAR